MQHGLPAGLIDPHEPHPPVHDLVEAPGPIPEAKQGLAGLEPAIDPGGPHGRRKPILISHGLSPSSSVRPPARSTWSGAGGLTPP